MINWLPIILRKGCSVLFYSYIIQGYGDAYHRELLGIPIGIKNHRYVDGWVVIDTDESERFTKAFASRLDDHVYVSFFLNQCRRLSNELLSLGRSIRRTDFTSHSSSDVLCVFSAFSSSSIRLMPFLTTMVLIQDVFESRLRNDLAKILHIPSTSQDLNEIMQWALFHDTEAPLATRSVRDLHALASLIERDNLNIDSIIAHQGELTEFLSTTSPPLLTMLTTYLEDYDFLGTDYYVGAPLDMPGVLKQIAAIRRRVAPTSTSESDVMSGHPMALRQKILEASSTVRELHFLRQHRIEALFKSGRDARKLFNEMAQRIGISYDELLALTFYELFDSIAASNLTVPLSVLQSRVREYGVLLEGGNCKYVIGNALTDLKRETPIQVVDVSVMTGVTAYSGVYEGIARVIDNVADVGTLKVGEILVAPMTSPYHVPAMTMAGPVITTEGGILSHAAILCRELQIPCIVGVTKAMEAIRTGSRIRVDAAPSQGAVMVLSF